MLVGTRVERREPLTLRLSGVARFEKLLGIKIKQVGYLKRFQERTLIKGLRSCTCVSSPRKRALAFYF